jgi:pimeloyl-ACP methyl ester carboxylesterase/dethiobiotin synthetase
MFMGTGSDVGKSLIVAGLARAFANKGLRVAPFKPQNMSNNAAVTEDGGEIGRAQALQARAARIPASVDMNPVLLKPESDIGSQIIIQGKASGRATARDYHALKPKLLGAVRESFARLKAQADLVLVEGAGSPAEINLRSGDIANMGFAIPERVPVVLIADIERGGAIASIVGTLAVLEPDERAAIVGCLVNKVRGDATLFDSGVAEIERRAVPCLGVIPYFARARDLPPEDSVGLEARHAGKAGAIKIRVPRLPRIANTDDLDPLAAEPDVDLAMLEPGDRVAAGQPVVVVETAKSATEIEAPAAGVLEAVHAEVGAEVGTGGLLGMIRAQGETAAPRVEAPVSVAAGRIRVSPAARRAARVRGIDLATLKPTSPSGRIKLRDLGIAAGQTAAAAPLAARVKPGGAGAPVVLLHGFAGDSSAWGPMLARLRSGATTIAIDLPGHGQSPLDWPLDSPTGPEALARAVAAHLRAAGIGEAHLVGHSLGGAVAMALAAGGQLRTRSLALLAPAGLGAQVDTDCIDGLVRATRAEALAAWLRELVADAALIDRDFLAMAMQARSRPGLLAAQRAIASNLFAQRTQLFDCRPMLARIDAPVKIVWGLADRIIPWQHAMGLSGREALHLLPGVGHLPHLEASAMSARLVDELVRSAR